MTRFAIFCPQCDTLLLEADQCPACRWQRLAAAGTVGQPVWTATLEAKLPRRESRPVVGAGFIYWPTDNGQIVALNSGAADPAGRIAWRYQLDSRYRCHEVALWADTVLLGSEYTGGFPAPEGELRLLSARSGGEVWRLPVAGASLSTPVVHQGVAYFTVNTGWLYAVDLANRRELHRYRILSPWSWGPAAPLLTPGGLLVLSSRSDYLVAVEATTGETAWSFPAGGWFPTSPVWRDGLVYACCWDRHIYALEAASGREVWRYRAPRDFSSDIWVGQDYLYVGVKDYRGGAEAGPRAYALHTLDRYTGRRVGRYETPGHLYARPVATESAVFCAADEGDLELDHQGTVYALDPPGQQVLWPPYPAAQEFQSNLLLVNDLLIAGTRPGTVVALRWRAAETVLEPPEFYLQREEWEQAAVAYARQGELARAAELYAGKLGQPGRAGQLYLHAGAYRRVVTLLRHSTAPAERDLALTAARALPKAAQRGRALRELSEYRAAAEAYIAAEAWLPAGECYEAAQAWAEARAVYFRANAWDRWEQLTRRLELWDELIERLRTVGNEAGVAGVYLERGQFLEAAGCYERAGRPAEALAAYKRVKPDLLTGEARRRLAELAEAAGEPETAIPAYEALGEWSKAAALAEAAGQYEPAVAFYRQAGQALKAAELLLKMARYAEAADLFAGLDHWGHAAGSLEQQVEQAIEQAGGVRNVRQNPQVATWLSQAAAWFDAGANVADDVAAIEAYNEGAERCRLKLRQVRGEPLLSWSVQAGDVLLVDEGNILHYVVENVGWGAAEEVTLSIGGNFLQGPETEQLGTLKRRQKKEGPITIVPKIPGQVTLRVELRGRWAGGDWHEAVPQTITVTRRGAARREATDTLNIQRPVSQPASAGALWDESGSSPPESDSPAHLKQQRIDSLRHQQAEHYANLNILQEQATQYAAGDTPLRLLKQIKSEQNAIAAIEEDLKELSTTP